MKPQDNHFLKKDNSIKEGDKFFIVVRSDIPVGRAAAQIVHAVVEFCLKHSSHILNWHSHSNYVAVLSVPNEIELMRLLIEAKDANVAYSAFKEPDLEYEYTAIALESSKASRALTEKLSLFK